MDAGNATLNLQRLKVQGLRFRAVACRVWQVVIGVFGFSPSPQQQSEIFPTCSATTCISFQTDVYQSTTSRSMEDGASERR